MHERKRRRREQVLGLGAAAAVTAAVLAIITLMAGSCRGEETETRRVRHNRSSISENLIELERQFSRNVAEVARWRCEPKQRLVYLSEASENVPVMPPDTAWLIHATVLHRCEKEMGCCPSQKECKPATTDKVRAMFKSVNLGTQVASYRHIQFDNHTSCACI